MNRTQDLGTKFPSTEDLIQKLTSSIKLSNQEKEENYQQNFRNEQQQIKKNDGKNFSTTNQDQEEKMKNKMIGLETGILKNLELANQNNSNDFSLRELSQLQNIKKQLDSLTYLNVYYNENARFKRKNYKVFKEFLELEKKITSRINYLYEKYLQQLGDLDLLRNYFIQKRHNPDEIVKVLQNIILLSQNFIVIYNYKQQYHMYSHQNQNASLKLQKVYNQLEKLVENKQNNFKQLFQKLQQMNSGNEFTYLSENPKFTKFLNSLTEEQIQKNQQVINNFSNSELFETLVQSEEMSSPLLKMQYKKKTDKNNQNSSQFQKNQNENNNQNNINNNNQNNIYNQTNFQSYLNINTNATSRNDLVVEEFENKEDFESKFYEDQEKVFSLLHIGKLQTQEIYLENAFIEEGYEAFIFVESKDPVELKFCQEISKRDLGLVFKFVAAYLQNSDKFSPNVVNCLNQIELLLLNRGVENLGVYLSYYLSYWLEQEVGVFGQGDARFQKYFGENYQQLENEQKQNSQEKNQSKQENQFQQRMNQIYVNCEEIVFPIGLDESRIWIRFPVFQMDLLSFYDNINASYIQTMCRINKIRQIQQMYSILQDNCPDLIFFLIKKTSRQIIYQSQMLKNNKYINVPQSSQNQLSYLKIDDINMDTEGKEKVIKFLKAEKNVNLRMNHQIKIQPVQIYERSHSIQSTNSVNNEVNSFTNLKQVSNQVQSDTASNLNSENQMGQVSNQDVNNGEAPDQQENKRKKNKCMVLNLNYIDDEYILMYFSCSTSQQPKKTHDEFPERDHKKKKSKTVLISQSNEFVSQQKNQVDGIIQELLKHYELQNYVKTREIHDILKKKVVSQKLEFQKPIENLSVHDLTQSFSLEYITMRDLPRTYRQSIKQWGLGLGNKLLLQQLAENSYNEKTIHEQGEEEDYLSGDSDDDYYDDDDDDQNMNKMQIFRLQANKDNKISLEIQNIKDSNSGQSYNNTSFNVNNNLMDENFGQENEALLRLSSNRMILSKSFIEISKQDKQLHNLLKVHEMDLENLSNWNFDITKIDDRDEKIRLIWSMFQLSNFQDFLNIDKEVFYQFLSEVADKYQKHQNPFHNFNHGFTVTHAMFCFLQLNIGEKFFSELDKFSLLLSCLGHDLEHTGRNNAFEVAKQSDIALRYNDESVLENHHCSQLFQILKKPDCNILKNVSNEDFKLIRRQCIHNILHTDMKKHFELLKHVEQKITMAKENNDQSWIKNDSDKMLISGFMVHAADLSGPARDFNIASQWSLNLSQEFTAQVQEEEDLGLPVTKYLSGLNVMSKMAKEEQNFIKLIVRPLWNIFKAFDQSVTFAYDNVEENLKQWEQVYQQEIEKDNLNEKQNQNQN